MKFEGKNSRAAFLASLRTEPCSQMTGNIFSCLFQHLTEKALHVATCRQATPLRAPSAAFVCRLHACRARARCARVLWTGPASSEGSLRERKAALAASGWPLRLRVRFIATCQCLCRCPAAQHARGARPRCRRKTLQPRTPGPGKALHRAASGTPSERASAPGPCGAAEADYHTKQLEADYHSV